MSGGRDASGEAGDRLRAGILAGATALALVVGGWWWQASAPFTGPAPGAPQSSAERSARLVPTDSDNGAVFRVDPSTGAAFRVDRGSAEAPGNVDGRRRGADAVEAELPHLPRTHWREQTALSPQRGVTRQAQTTDGAHYELQHSCVGSGDLRITVYGSRSAGQDQFQVECDGSLTGVTLVGSGDPLRISLTTADDRPIRVEAQLVALA
ncbi:hypothetical protein ACFOOK_19560 [Micromonospora krabiensis]|uniref:hypothetical protein n=1 Tax=Micromonospora krabiensis TaxID=307121 RepID=UPI0012FDDD96|nr:hypothetical protein [Micromonospora krabiensis]